MARQAQGADHKHTVVYVHQFNFDYILGHDYAFVPTLNYAQPPPPGTCLSGGGGGGPGEGGGVPPPRRNVRSPQGTENLLGNGPLSTWKCHLVGSKQSQFIIAGQFKVPSSNQDTTNRTKRDIHHLMPTHSDHGQSKLDSPELEPPSVVEVELEPDDDEESESLPEWETSDKCCHWHTEKRGGTCLLCLIVCLLSLPASDPIFKPKIKQRVDYVFAFCAWRRLDWRVEIH